MQQSLLSPTMQGVSRFVSGRAWYQEAVKRAKPLESAHTLSTAWQKHLTKGVGQRCFCCLGWVSG